jgi:GR25 family glycosyltransferase involved in LPS biosynthesis
MIWSNIFTVFINLPNEKIRRSFMEAELSKMSIPYTVLDATDGRTCDFTDIYDESIAITSHGAPLTPPEKGCALSHRRALDSFLASGKPYGLIMEDDVVLDDAFPHAVMQTLERKDWAYVQFNYGPVGWQGVFLWWFLLRNRKKGSTTHSILFALKGITVNLISLAWGVRDRWYRITNRGALCSIVRDQYLAGCYLLTREAAEALIELNTPLIYTADRVQNIARRKGLLIHKLYVPRIVRQKRESFASSINNMHFGKDIISA